LTVFVRVYGSLNDFLSARQRQSTLACEVNGVTSVKDLIEAVGVPHPEIDLLVVNGTAVKFDHLIRDGDRVAAYPRFELLDPGPSIRLGPAIRRHVFVADVHLGRLAAYLRLAGFDVDYRVDYSDHEIAGISALQDRTVLTRDVGLLKHGRIRHGYFIRDTHPARQLVEVIRRFELVDHAVPFSRCLRCNWRLDLVSKQEVEHRLQESTRERYNQFSRCPGCQRLYWQGSHYARLRAFLDAALAAAASPPVR
jgi:uncharacterized protein with PIN domain/sulfur carrier protein ThiS